MASDNRTRTLCFRGRSSPAILCRRCPSPAAERLVSAGRQAACGERSESQAPCSGTPVKHRAQALRSFLFGRHAPFPERPEELDLRADKIHRLPKQLVFLHFLLAEAGSFPSSLVAYAKRWSRDSGRSSLRERVLGRDRLASSIHGLEYKYSRMRQTYS